jgi:hypothetical protein
MGAIPYLQLRKKCYDVLGVARSVDVDPQVSQRINCTSTLFNGASAFAIVISPVIAPPSKIEEESSLPVIANFGIVVEERWKCAW